jgi:hypothetical protein
LAAQHIELVAQDGDLDILGVVALEAASSVPTNRRVMR